MALYIRSSHTRDWGTLKMSKRCVDPMTDVDGFEDKVVEGSMKTFKNCKGLLIEVNNKNVNYISMITALGYNLVAKHKRNEDEYNYILKNGN